MPDDPDFDPVLISELAQTSFGRALADAPIRYFHARLLDSDRIPASGPALLVGNHALLGLDGFVLAALILRKLHRVPRFLGERNLWRIPGLGRFLTTMGAIPGSPDTAIELLQAGELVIVYPGGVDDSFKASSKRYELQWGSRAGFARVAMRARAPIVPVAALGIDDMYEVVGHESWLGRRLFGATRYDLPIALGAFGTPIPRRAPQTYCVLSPIDTTGDAENTADVERVRAATFAALDAKLAEARKTVTPSTDSGPQDR
jgi:1-acyl-sn-glycerol-3-phosphate acyltransferase